MSDFLHVTIDTREAERILGYWAERDLPYAMSRAINQTVEQAQAALRGRLRDDVTVRNSWVARGIRIERSSKTHLIGAVGTVDPIMAALSEGGPRPDTGGKDASVPIGGEGGGRPTPETITTKKYWPSRILAQRDPATGTKTAFRRELKSGKIAIYRRIGEPEAKVRGKGMTRPRIPLKLVYVIQHIPPILPQKWHFKKHANLTFKEVLQSNLIEWCDRILAEK